MWLNKNDDKDTIHSSHVAEMRNAWTISVYSFKGRVYFGHVVGKVTQKQVLEE
jgi:hypothetical protein